MSKILGEARKAESRLEYSTAEISVGYVNYGLGFNDVDFSDRVLRLEVEKSVTDLEVQVETLNVCSLMLAAKSPFFYKLFKNGMKESKLSEFTMRINESEKAGFMDMLNSIYDRPLKASSRDELVDVMIVADKFEVASCAVHCVQLLLKSPMTMESALLYLEFPSILYLVGEVTHTLVDAAKQHLSSHFSGFTKSKQEEAMSLPLCGIEAVVGAADFEVKSEEELLDFMLMWARKHYPDLEVRRDILTNRLLGLICLPCLSYSKLMEMVDYHDCDSAQMAKLVLKALSYKIELRHGPNSIPTVNEALLSNNAVSNCAFPRRAYNHRRVVFFDIKEQECLALAENSRIDSEAFFLGGRRFSLSAQRCKKEGSSTERLGLFVEMGGSGSCSISFEFSAMMKPSNEFIRLFTVDNRELTETSKTWGILNLLKMRWTEPMGDDDNEYIIDGVIHIRAQVTMNNVK